MVHPVEKLLKQLVFTMVQGYEDVNEVYYLKNDPLLKDILEGELASQPTHGDQQLSMFNGYYGQFMYNELFFYDGDTGQIILPVLRPGNSHSNNTKHQHFIGFAYKAGTWHKPQ